MWLSQDLPYAKVKIRENTNYWKSDTTLWKCQFSPTDYWDCYWRLTATARVYLCICYIHMKFLTYPECRYVIASLTSVFFFFNSVGRVNVSFQARVANFIPELIHAHTINTKPNRIFSFFIPFPIPWGVIISKRSTEIIT